MAFIHDQLGGGRRFRFLNLVDDLPWRSLTKRLVNHARPADLTEGYAADWTVEQHRESA